MHKLIDVGDYIEPVGVEIMEKVRGIVENVEKKIKFEISNPTLGF